METLNLCVFCCENSTSLIKSSKSHKLENQISELHTDLSLSICKILEIELQFSALFKIESLCTKCYELFLNIYYALNTFNAVKKQIKHSRKVLRQGFLKKYEMSSKNFQKISLLERKFLFELNKLASSSSHKNQETDVNNAEIKCEISNATFYADKTESKYSSFGRKIISKYGEKVGKTKTSINRDAIVKTEDENDCCILPCHPDSPLGSDVELISNNNDDDLIYEVYVPETSNQMISSSIESDFQNAILKINESRNNSTSTQKSTQIKSKEKGFQIKNTKKVYSRERNRNYVRPKKKPIDAPPKESLAGELKYCCNVTLACRENGKIYDEIRTLKNHIKYMHQRVGLSTPFHCSACELQLGGLKELENHEAFAHGMKHVCDKCGKGFNRRDQLLKHVVDQHGKRDRPKCSICSKFFETAEEVGSHEVLHCQNLESESAFNCVLCTNGIFLSVFELRKHVLATHETDTIKCPFCPEVFLYRTNYHNHKKMHKDRELKCPECPSMFSKPTDLRHHVLKHSEPAHVCHFEGCGKKYYLKSQINYHLAKSHGLGDKKLKCQLCPKVFLRHFELKNHQIHHFNVRPFLCELCSASFKTKRNLQTHMKTHRKKGIINMERSKARRGRITFDSSETISQLAAKNESFTNTIPNNNHSTNSDAQELKMNEFTDLSTQNLNELVLQDTFEL